MHIYLKASAPFFSKTVLYEFFLATSKTKKTKQQKKKPQKNTRVILVLFNIPVNNVIGQTVLLNTFALVMFCCKQYSDKKIHYKRTLCKFA